MIIHIPSTLSRGGRGGLVAESEGARGAGIQSAVSSGKANLGKRTQALEFEHPTRLSIHSLRGTIRVCSRGLCVCACGTLTLGILDLDFIKHLL